MEEIRFRYKKHLIVGCFFLIFIILCIIINQTYKKERLAEATRVAKQKEQLVKKEETKEEKPMAEPKRIVVDVKGAVVNPGIYEMDSQERVRNAIDKAGGTTPTADTSVINLSKNLKDEMVIIVYTKQEVKDMLNDKYKEKECSCPILENDACIQKETETKKETTPTKGKVSINNGTKEELTQLPGVGETKAQSIIQYRTEHGPFQSLEELENVPGIGESTFAKLKDFIRLE